MRMGETFYIQEVTKSVLGRVVFSELVGVKQIIFYGWPSVD